MNTDSSLPSAPERRADAVSIIIPAYNEEEAIATVVKDVVATIDESELKDYEILVIDDGSSDRTAEMAKSAGATVIRNVHNIGYGFSLKQGIKAARNDTIVIIDADATYPVDRIPSLVEKYNEGFDLVVGARSGRYYRESLIKFPLRVVFKWLVEFTVGRLVYDVNSGLRVFSREEVTPYFPRLSNTFSFTTSQTLAYMLNMKFVTYVPIDYKKRIGRSKVRLFRDSLGALQMIVSAILYFNPLKLFIVLSAATGLLSLAAFAAWLVWDLRDALWMGFASVLVAVVVFALGFLADLLHQRESRHGPE